MRNKVYRSNKKKQRNMSLAVPICFLILFCMIGIWAGYKLWEGDKEYAVGNQAYESITEQIRAQQTLSGLLSEIGENGPDNQQTPGKKNNVYVEPIAIDFPALKKINADAVAWLYSPGTVIDYPVMRAKDYDYYLHHLPDGTYNKNGTLFLDYNGKQDFSERLNVIYGHNMKSGRMFGSLSEYKKQEYFDDHPYMYLYTENGNYRIALKYGCVIGENEWILKEYMLEDNLDALLKYAQERTTFESDAVENEMSRYIVMSTCSYEFNNARYLVLGLLEPEFI